MSEQYAPSRQLCDKICNLYREKCPAGPKLEKRLQDIPRDLTERFYDVFRNLRMGSEFRAQCPDAFTNDKSGRFPFPQNPFLSVISTSRDSFSNHLSKTIRGILPEGHEEEILREWCREFYDFVSQKGDFTYNLSSPDGKIVAKIGDIFLEGGAIYFLAPEKPLTLTQTN